MAKWRRGGGGRRRWVIEYVPKAEPITPKVIEIEEEADPFTFDTPEAIVAALWRFEQRKMLAEEKKE